MSTKKMVLDLLVKMRDHERGISASVINDCIEAIEGIPDSDEKCKPAAAPNYEAMYMKAMKELEQHKNMLACSDQVICDMRVENARLLGFKEAVDRIFPEKDSGLF